MTPVAVLFDFDGVLVDSMPAHVDAWSEATRTLFGKGLSLEERRTIVGKSTRVIANLISDRRGNLQASIQLTNLKRESLFTQLHRVQLFPGVTDMLEYLQMRRISFGIASNAPRDFVQKAVATLNLPVDVALGCEDVVNPKPAPDLYLLCAKKLGVSPADHRRVLVFEDSTHGIEAAVRAGTYPIGITTHQTAKALRQSGARYTYPGFKELLASGLLA